MKKSIYKMMRGDVMDSIWNSVQLTVNVSVLNYVSSSVRSIDAHIGRSVRSCIANSVNSSVMIGIRKSVEEMNKRK